MSLIDQLKAQLVAAVDQAYAQGVADGKEAQLLADVAPVQAMVQELSADAAKVKAEADALLVPPPAV